MMSVNELINHPVYDQNISIEGCIVIIDEKLWLIDSRAINDFPHSKKILINNTNLKTIMLKSVALYSGVTALFHDVKIKGYVLDDNSLDYLSIKVNELCVKDGNLWKEIALDTVNEHKNISEENKLDWNDLFK